MDEQSTDVERTGSYGRREVLRRGAIVIGAATLWTTPVVQSLGMRPAAAGTGDDTDTDGSLCPPGSVGSAQPRDLIFRWNGVGGPSPALVVIQRPGSERLCVVVGAGGFFQVANQAGSNWKVGVYDAGDVPSSSGSGNRWRNLPDGGHLLDHSEFHTSCSEPLNLGDSFGTITLVAGTPPGDDRPQQVLNGVSLAGVQVATTNCAALTTVDESEDEAEEVEAEELETEETGIEELETEELDTEELKTEAVEVEEGGVETDQVEPEKVEAPRGADPESEGADVDVAS